METTALRLSNSSSPIYLENGRQSLYDLQKIYQGTIANQSKWNRLNMRKERQPDFISHCGKVIANVTSLDKAVVHIKDIDNPINAAKWTAAQAYHEKNGVRLEKLHMEVDGSLPHREWQKRRGLEHSEMTRIAIAEDAAYLAALEQAQTEEEAKKIQNAYDSFLNPKNPDEPVYTFQPYLQEADVLMPKDITRFVAEGDGLLDAAGNMLQGYEELNASRYNHADVEVGRALGGRSYEHFEDVYARGIQAGTGVAAGSLVLHELTAPL